MSIHALLHGVSDYLGTKVSELYPVGDLRTAAKLKVQPRWGNNGAPMGAWRTAMGWYIGVYFGGARGGARESYGLRYTVGIDFTRMIPDAPSGEQRTDKLLEDAEIYDVAGRISELMLGGRSIVANACTTALAGTWQEGKGLFRENFEECEISPLKTPGPEWCLQKLKKASDVPNIAVISLSCSGIVWRKNFSNLFGESA